MLRGIERLRLWLPVRLKRAVQLCCDVAVLTVALVAAYYLRFDFAVPPDQLHGAAMQLWYVVPLQLAALYLAGTYRFVWRYVGLADAWSFATAATIASVPILLIRLLPHNFASLRMPLSIILLDALLAFTGVLGLRILARAAYESAERKRHLPDATNLKAVLLIGAGRAGMLAARELLRRADAGLEIRGFVDDDPTKVGSNIQGIRVIGTTADLPRLVAEYGIDHVIITIAQAKRQQITRIVQICEAIPIRARITPGLYEILGGQVEVSRIRNIEIEDLLGRETVRLESADIERLLAGKTVMVTGAGGSIGSELARQVVRFNPASLLLVERAEFALFDIDRELRQTGGKVEIRPLVADAGDEARMRGIFKRFRPEVVIHAAAHKHVPMMELQPAEAIKNNVMVTRRLASLAGEFEVEAFVLISTDKAVNPTSVMGASKRVAELVIQDLSQLSRRTRFLAVRFGNVLGSAGSVIPIFRKQIASGGPVTVTHPDMTRYFMTIPEAAQLVLGAAAIGRGGEIFVLDMGEPVKILDLATQMIKLSGFKPHEDIQIVFSGIRPGEKLFEELDRMGETISRTKHPKIFNGNLMPYPPDELSRHLQKLEDAARRGFDVEVRRVLAAMLPEAQLESGDHVQDDLSDLVAMADLQPVADVGDGRTTLKGKGERKESGKHLPVSYPRAAD
jgi:FlaA1/EpsC-like NDP-sugar epimerase